MNCSFFTVLYDRKCSLQKRALARSRVHHGYFLMKIRLCKTLVSWNDEVGYFLFLLYYGSSLFSSRLRLVLLPLRVLLVLQRGSCAESRNCFHRWMQHSSLLRKRSRSCRWCAFRNGQLHLGDQILSVNEIYLDSRDPTLAIRAHQLLLNSTRLTIELVVVSTAADHPHESTSQSNNDGHRCVPTLSTPFHVDMVVRYWLTHNR